MSHCKPNLCDCINMKRIFLSICCIVALIAPTNLYAQTPEEVVQRMYTELEKGNTQDLVFDMVMSIPIIGEFRSTNSVLGDKLKTEITEKGNNSISWSDGTTKWEYESETNEVRITNAVSEENKENSGNMDLVEGITSGYDLSFEKKTDDEVWYIQCKRKRSNPDKSDPKRMYLAISKADYLPIYIQSKAKCIRISMENYRLGVTEAQVTFNPADYPNAKIIDEH